MIALLNALRSIYPESCLLLCIFHILQAFWRFLWDVKNGVNLHHRGKIFGFLKAMVFSSSENMLLDHFNAALANSIVCKYPNVCDHLHDIVVRRSEWALCCRSDMMIRGHNTNNYCESAMRVLKDKIMHRTKAFNICQLIDFMLTRFDAHYQRRLIDVANNRTSDLQSSRFMPDMSDISRENIRETDEEYLYEVSSASKPGVVYTVNMLIDHCSCEMGKTGGPCKHQCAVSKAFSLRSSNFLPTMDPKARQDFYYVATGSRAVSTEWFQSLRPANDCIQITANARTVAEVANCPQESISGDVNIVNEPVSDEIDQSLIDAFTAASSKLVDMYTKFPSSIGPSMKSFCEQVDKMSTVSAVQSALHTFGKYSGLKPGGKGRLAASSTSIGVQPTAIARRKMLVGGRRRLHLGRPPKSSFTSEHGYFRDRSNATRQVMPKRRAPHCLSEAVDNLQTLGITHSAK